MWTEEQCAFMDSKFVYIHLFSVILFVFRSAPWLVTNAPKYGGRIFYMMHRQR